MHRILIKLWRRPTWLQYITYALWSATPRLFSRQHGVSHCLAFSRQTNKTGCSASLHTWFRTCNLDTIVRKTHMPVIYNTIYVVWSAPSNDYKRSQGTSHLLYSSFFELRGRWTAQHRYACRITTYVHRQNVQRQVVNPRHAYLLLQKSLVEIFANLY